MFIILVIIVSGCLMESGDMLKIVNRSNENITMMKSDDSIVSKVKLIDYFASNAIQNHDTAFSIRQDIDIRMPEECFLTRARYGNNIKSNPPYYIFIINSDSLKAFSQGHSPFVSQNIIRFRIRVDYFEFKRNEGEFIYIGQHETH